MADDHEGFLSRWSRRKQDGRGRASEKQTESIDHDEVSEVSDVDTTGGSETDGERQEMIDSLPDPDSLTEQDDFTQFMQEGVPEDLRHRALQRLWRSNPVFAVRDGLNDYDLDYTDAATVVENIKSAFQVGRGVVTEEERAAESETAPKEGMADHGGTDDETASETEGHTANGPPSDTGMHEENVDTADISPAEDSEAKVQRPPRRFSKVRADEVMGAGTTQQEQRRGKGSAAQRRWGGFNT